MMDQRRAPREASNPAREFGFVVRPLVPEGHGKLPRGTSRIKRTGWVSTEFLELAEELFKVARARHPDFMESLSFGAGTEGIRIVEGIAISNFDIVLRYPSTLHPEVFHKRSGAVLSMATQIEAVILPLMRTARDA